MLFRASDAESACACVRVSEQANKRVGCEFKRERERERERDNEKLERK